MKILKIIKDTLLAFFVGIFIAAFSQLSIAADFPPHLDEHEITYQNLSKIFISAFIKTSLDKGGFLIVHADGQRFFVVLNEDKKIIKFLSLYGIKKSAQLALQHKLANKLNSQFNFVRLSAPEKYPNKLFAEYDLSFDNGILPYQIIKAVRILSQLRATIQINDTDDVLE